MMAWFLAWLWQGLALALAVSTVFRLVPRVTAATRYLIWWSAFVALIWLGWRSSPLSMPPPAITAALESLSPPSFAFQVPSLPPWTMMFIVGAWAAGAVFKLLRVLSGLHGLYRLKNACHPIPRTIEDELPLWQETKRRGRFAPIVFCDELSGAAVLGLRQPCIAFPRLLLEVVNVGELDQIVLHEYAHVQRRDDWIRLGQALLAAAAWIHPAVFWIGRELNLEREVACDDWVIARTAAPRAYAVCLSRVAENRSCPETPVFAPVLFGGKRALFRRVDRLLDARRDRKQRLSPVTACAGICCLGLATVHLSGYSLIVERAALPVVASQSAGLKPGPAPDVGLAFPPSRGFGEVSPAFAEHGRTTADRPAESAGLYPGPTPDARLAFEPTQSAGLKPGSTPDVGLAVRPAETDAVPVVQGRSFNDARPAVVVSDSSQTRQAANGWQLAGTAGVNIGRAASRAGVGIANTFSRAGVSLARRF